MEKTIEALREIGFNLVGFWIKNEKDKLDYNINNEDLNKEHLLYAFESDSIVKYIGITEDTLKKRMGSYKSGHNESAGSTNKDVYSEIIKLINNNKEVNIYILKENAPCKFGEYEISLATGIEKSLIKAFDFKDNLWNSRGTTNPNQEKNKKIKTNLPSNLEENQSVIKLGKYAYNNGIIIFKKDLDGLLSVESDDMDIIYNNCTYPGYFTRSFKNIKTNGYNELKKIFENDFKPNDSILVTLLNPNEVKIEKYID